MNLTPESLARHELIGLFAQVEVSSDPGLVGLSGQVVDETRNTFLLETAQRVLRIPKIEHEPDLYLARWAKSKG